MLGVDGVVLDLNFVARVFITNDETRTILENILDHLRKRKSTANDYLPQRPGVVFSMGSEEGNALLGAPKWVKSHIVNRATQLGTGP
jgi:hypothetical protein